MRFVSRFVVAASLMLSMLIDPAAAEEYPARNIVLIVPFGAGTGADTAARIVADRLGPRLGTSIVIENRVGAGGIVGSRVVARAAPDGYTLLLASNSTHGTNPSLFKDLSYDPVADFSPVGRLGSFIFLLTVNPELSVGSVRELVDAARKSPGKLSYAAGQPTSRIMAEVFKRETGTDILFVPYKSSPQAVTDLVAGRVSMMFIDRSAIVQFLESGQLKPLAITSSARSTMMPEVPTIAEAIGSKFELEAWVGIVAPAGTPDPVLEKLHAGLNAVLAMPDIKDRLHQLGIEPRPSATPAEFRDFIKSEVSRLGQYVKQAGIEPQ